MSSKSNAGVFGPKNGLAKALLDIEAGDYPDAESAIRAALASCPRYRCENCGRDRYSNRRACKQCGGTEFHRYVPDGGGK